MASKEEFLKAFKEDPGGYFLKIPKSTF